MNIVKRLVCYIVGHNRMAPFVDDFPKMYSKSDILEYKFSRAYFQHCGETIAKHRHYQILAIPHNSNVCICNRCKTLYSTIGTTDTYLCDISRIPGLQEFNHLYNRLIWEKCERRTNLAADKLYKQYLMALKLGAADEHAKGRQC